jgi:glycosyltransferase involved in cell wall biosynthesis
MSAKKDISVIIPTFNRRDFIADAVESVLFQGIKNLEIIVVDDGSSDDTKSILERYADRVRYIYQDNQGVSAARNRGVIESRGRLLAFLDSDDVWAPGKLRAQLGTTSDDVLSFEGVEWFLDRPENPALPEEGLGVKWPRCATSGYVVDPVLDVAEGRYFHLGTLLCEKDTFLRIGLFDETLCMGEDEDWFSRAAAVTRFHYLPEPLLRRRFHAGQTPPESEKSLRSLITVFSNIKTRTKGSHRAAYVAANKRLAAKWSHLANMLKKEGRHREASQAAKNAYLLEPSNVRRLAKALAYQQITASA